MKRICSLMLCLLFVFSVGFTAHAEDLSETDEYLYDEAVSYPDELTEQESVSDIEDSATSGMPSVETTTQCSMPTLGAPWNDFQHVSVTFFVSTNSLATVSYHAVAQHSSSIEVTVYFEKHVFGSIWERVNIGTNGNKLTNRANGYYISGTETVKVSGEGKYRAVVTVKNSYGSADSSNTFTFSKYSTHADVNADGKVTAVDARLALRFSAGVQKYTSDQKNRSDVNCDGSITAADARIILRIAAKLM